MRDLLLWALVSANLVGAAFLFRWLFPRESRWLAFLIPVVVIVLLCNFVEHHLALTLLRLLLPVTTYASFLLTVRPGAPWRTMRLPAGLFVGAFTFAMILRVLRPELEYSTDAIYDAGLMSHFTSGQTLPVDGIWLPPVKFLYYYCLPHYGASVLIRLLGVDLGTGYNISTALLSAYLTFLAGAAAWHLGRGKLWITISASVLTACSATGAVGYLWFTMADLTPDNVTNLNSMLDNPASAHNFLLRQIPPMGPNFGRVLFPPGIGNWTGSFHSMNAGQLVLGFGLLAFIELVRRKKTNWPWICLALFPFLQLTSCTWGLPIAGFIVAAALIICVGAKIMPQSLAFVAATSAGLIVLLEPMLSYFLSIPMLQIVQVPTNQRTALVEFLAQWWPVFLPWLALCFIWKRTLPVTRVVLILAPVAFIGAEIFALGWRCDMTGKFWALIFAAAWFVFLPEIARQKAWPFRVLLILIALNCVLSFCFWSGFYARTVDRGEIGRLEGLGQFHTDPHKARILEIVSRLQDQIIIPGRDVDGATPNKMVIELTHNRAYATWEVLSDCVFYPNGIGESGRRMALVNSLYDGTMKHPLTFLRQNKIGALVIYPDDDIDPAVVAQLKKDLAPYYTYDDANFRSAEDIQNDVTTERPFCGVFLFHPEISALLGSPPEEGKK